MSIFQPLATCVFKTVSKHMPRKLLKMVSSVSPLNVGPDYVGFFIFLLAH